MHSLNLSWLFIYEYLREKKSSIYGKKNSLQEEKGFQVCFPDRFVENSTYTKIITTLG